MPMTKALEDLKRSMLWQNVIIVLLLGLLAAIVFIDRNNDGDRRAREAQRQVDGRVEACHSYNVDKTLQRNFQINNILTLSQLTGRDPEALKVDPRFAKYTDFVDKSYPYRQCSVDCVNALFDPKIPDCAIASNENGDP